MNIRHIECLHFHQWPLALRRGTQQVKCTASSTLLRESFPTHGIQRAPRLSSSIWCRCGSWRLSLVGLVCWQQSSCTRSHQSGHYSAQRQHLHVGSIVDIYFSQSVVHSYSKHFALFSSHGRNLRAMAQPADLSSISILIPAQYIKVNDNFSQQI
jgi:hypothetical protein